MLRVEMPRADWDTVIWVMTAARDAEIVAYIDNIIDDIDNQIYSQES